jgi:hypothetical protein
MPGAGSENAAGVLVNSATQIAIVVAGQKNLTKITGNRDLTENTLESFRKVVIRKDPSRSYYIFECFPSGAQKKKKGAALYAWHVGEGFEHSEGWWVDA